MMHAASRDALAVARAELDDRASRASVDDLGRLADELFSVVDLLDREPGLRRGLSESATRPDDRAGMLDAVLGSRLSAETIEVLRHLVRSRWSQPRDLSDSVEALAEQASLEVAGRDGRMDDVEDELFRFGRIVAAQPELRRLLEDRRAPADRRVALLDHLVEGKVQPATHRLLDRVVRAPRGRSLEGAITDLVHLAADRRERYVAYVQAAAPFTGEQESRLTSALARIYGRPVSIRLEIVPSLLGGLVIRVRDEVINGSVLRQLDEARRRLAS